MNSPVYTFGPQAHPAIALSLRDALMEMFPQFKFDVEMMSTLSGFRETVSLLNHSNGKPVTGSSTFQRMVMFAQGFVAGFGGGIQPPTRQEAMRRTMTRADCPAAKRKSDPPPPAPDSTPTLPSQPNPTLPTLKRRNTMMGVAPPSRRVG